jgi:capsular exopolysaccharide synthesis family protein
MENSDNNTQPQAQPTQKVVKKKKVIVGGGYGYGGGYGGYGHGGYSGYSGGYGYGGGYGANYGGYGASYYAGGYGAKTVDNGGTNGMPNRTFRDYMMILRERIWYIIVTFFVIFAGVLLYTFRMTPIYTSVATIQVLRDSDVPINGPGGVQQSRNEIILSTEDFNTQVKLMESMEVVSAVKSRLKEDEIKSLMNPFNDMITFGPKKTEEEILAQYRKVIPERLSLIVRIMFEHPDAQMAARITNLFATEYISYTHQVKVQKLMNSIDELRTKVSQQEAKVKELDKKLVEYRKEQGGVSLDQLDDVDRNELRDINSILTNDKRVFDAMSTQWDLVQEYNRLKKDLCTLPFIAELPGVAKLVTDKSTQQVIVAGLEKRYKEKHPKMIEARKTLDQIEKELQVAIETACSKIRASYENAKQNYEQSQKRLSVKKEEILGLAQKAIIYKSIERERQVAELMHQSLIQSLSVRTAQVSLINEGANIVDRAGISPRPSSPNYVLNIILGLFAGIAGGIGMAFLVAFFDDRTKSSYDVESVIGLPLLGVIPRIKRLSSSEKAQVAASNADRATTEAFRSLHSTLKVNSLSKNAKVVLFTSTTPSEGKSFVVSNLAFTCALNGEKVIVIDADLRLPALAKILDINTTEGIVSCIEEGKPLESAIVKDYFPNLDVLVCEKRAPNPTQMLNSEEFISFILALREKYDRIFIDSPPIGAVSDAISLLPNTDGIIYVIKFNVAKRKAVRNYVRRMMETNVPVFGAVMNMVTSSLSSSYSLNYYDKSYQNYYTTPPEVQPRGDVEPSGLDETATKES